MEEDDDDDDPKLLANGFGFCFWTQHEQLLVLVQQNVCEIQYLTLFCQKAFVVSVNLFSYFAEAQCIISKTFEASLGFLG